MSASSVHKVFCPGCLMSKTYFLMYFYWYLIMQIVRSRFWGICLWNFCLCPSEFSFACGAGFRKINKNMSYQKWRPKEHAVNSFLLEPLSAEEIVPMSVADKVCWGLFRVSRPIVLKRGVFQAELETEIPEMEISKLCWIKPKLSGSPPN